MASQKVAQKATDKVNLAPGWTQRFRYLVIKPGPDVPTREIIVGKTQAAQEKVQTQALSGAPLGESPKNDPDLSRGGTPKRGGKEDHQPVC